LVSKPLLIGALLIVALVPLAVLAGLIALGVQGITGVGDLDYLGPWRFGVGVGVVLCALVPAATVLVIGTLEALYALLCAVGRALLGARASSGGPVREMLAESLGDSTVAIAYWLPDRQAFVDEAGRPVDLPEPDSGRAWTAVERDGRPVAAIVHDAALDTSPELVHAAAAASLLAIDNERLKADLRARVEELRVSRLRIVEAADEARRRIDGLARRLEVALGELRELARGIHPAILTQSGLAAAVQALADRATVPVEVEVAVDRRLPAPVEAAAYFLVAEALTNVTRYAKATGAEVTIAMEGDDVRVTVADDGVGGVDVASGSGLRGLQDRLATVEGRLEIDSPPGGGTRLTGRIPSGAGQRDGRPWEASA
jgi:two-component sensor histidine kinase